MTTPKPWSSADYLSVMVAVLADYVEQLRTITCAENTRDAIHQCRQISQLATTVRETLILDLIEGQH